MRVAAFFDMDGTLLRGESQLSFLLWCWRRGIAPRFKSLQVLISYTNYLFGFSSDAVKLRELGFGLFSGLAVDLLENAGGDFYKKHLALRIRRQSAALVQAHRALGHNLVLVTSASEVVARPVFKALGLDALIATQLVALDGIYTGARQIPEPYAAQKQKIVAQFCADKSIAPEKSFAYSDHHSDLPLLEFVGHPIVVHPTRKLKQIAVERRWKITDLDETDAANLTFHEVITPC